MSTPAAQLVSSRPSPMANFNKFCQSTLLLLIRIYFFLQLFKIGRAKLENIATPIAYFTHLGIPFPEINAYVAGATECFGSILIIAGLASRLAAFPVTFAMGVALWFAYRDAVLNIWGHPNKFLSADPFPFFLAALIILCFGPGWFSLDAIFGRLFRRKREE